MINELDSVILTVDIPYLNLKKGDMGTVVMVHNNCELFAIEWRKI